MGGLAHFDYERMGVESARLHFHEDPRRSARDIQQTRMKGLTDDLEEQNPSITDEDKRVFRTAFYDMYAKLQGVKSTRLMRPNGKGYRESKQ